MKAYSKEDIYDIERNTRLVSSDPYKLFVAFVLSSFSDVVEDGDDIIGSKFPEEVANEIIKDCIEDFINAADNGLTLEIWCKPYSIRNKRVLKKDLLPTIFKLKTENGISQLEIGNIFDVSIASNNTGKEANDENMSYFQKIVMLSDSTDDGYDKLTDMEAAVYCWGLFHSKNFIFETGPCMYSKFYEKYKDFFGLDMHEVMGCVCDGQRFPYNYWSFSAEKIRAWNKANNQRSYVDEIDGEEAKNYWYDKALPGRFKEK